MMKTISGPRVRVGALALAAALSVAMLTSAQAKVLAKVNGIEITDDDVKMALEDLGATLPAQMEGKAKETYILDYLIDAKLVSQKAEAEKMGQNPEFTKKLAYMREKALMEALLGKVAKEAGTDEAMKATYETAAKDQKAETEVHARHILVPTEEEAKTALKRVKGGEDFAKVAKEMSKDPGSEGGDLGWFTKDRMVPEFAEAAFKLEPGQYSEPVKSQFGYHVIRLEEKRQKAFPSFEQVKDQVARYVVQKSQSELIIKLREGAKIERTEVAAEAPKADAPKDAKPAVPATPAAPKK